MNLLVYLVKELICDIIAGSYYYDISKFWKEEYSTTNDSVYFAATSAVVTNLENKARVPKADDTRIMFAFFIAKKCIYRNS